MSPLSWKDLPQLKTLGTRMKLQIYIQSKETFAAGAALLMACHTGNTHAEG